VDATPFGHYQLQELIGRGGMGEVYKAYDTKTDRIVALKVLPANMAADETFQARFKRESQAAAQLNDPHVVPIHGFGEIDGRLYLDMRLIEGRNLGTILNETDKPLEPEFAVKVVEQVATALDAAHAAGLIHRDVKPSNILITPADFVYLIDFGLARTAGEVGLTTAGSTLGTMAYMAPERFEGKPVDPTSDIYALACVLYECLTGDRPYPAESLEQQIAGHMTQPIPQPSAVNPKLVHFDEIIAKGMAKKPAKRYQTAAELAGAARRALGKPVRVTGSGRHSRRAPTKRKASGRTLAFAGAVALLLVAGGIGVWQLTASDGDDATPGDPSTPTPNAAPAAVEDIAATLPEEIRAAGRLKIGVEAAYAPNEFKDASGAIVGFDVDLMNAITRTLGLVPDYQENKFDAIIPLVQANGLDVGMSSFTDTKEREELVDFVDYFQAGTLWAQRAGSGIDPANACGLSVGVVLPSLQEAEDIPERSAACEAAGLPPIDKRSFEKQEEVNAALMNGEIDAMSADSPVTLFAIKTSGGALEKAGDVFNTEPYGWPVAKGSPLAESLLKALQHVIDTGEYKTIATMWGVEQGMIITPGINGAKS
jgi:ABC-type amino acid transport substrate-binding protein/predicted Ser/Thr protein kinase